MGHIIETMITHDSEASPIVVEPLQLWFIGLRRGDTPPTVWLVEDGLDDGAQWTFDGLTRIERAAFRALLDEAAKRLDATEAGS